MFNRCKARLPRQRGDLFWGRCDRNRNHAGEHELERGFFTVSWPTKAGARR